VRESRKTNSKIEIVSTFDFRILIFRVSAAAARRCSGRFQIFCREPGITMSELTHSQSQTRREQLRDVIISCMNRRAAGQAFPDTQVIAEHPDLMPELADELAKLRLISAVGHMASGPSASLSSFAGDDGSLPSLISGSVLESGEFRGAARTPETADLPEIPDYRIVRELHSGGQGVVYEAVQLSTRRTVALKLLQKGSGASRRSRQRFEREIELIAALHHPNIVTIHDSGITRGQYYYAMDYVRGQPLDTHVRLTRPALRELMKLFKTICDAVAYAHRMGVIHRDLKPSNIMVDPDNSPVVLDFGLARILGTPDHATLTMPGVLLGTVPYMSPEQTLGTPEAIDTRTDVYALAVILFELLTGTPPYTTRGVDLAQAFENIRNVDPPRPSKWSSQANSEIDAIVLKAMEKDPNRRYGSAAELAEDIAAWLEGRPVQAKSASSLYVIRKLARKHYFESLVVLAMVLAIGSAFTIAVQSYTKRQEAIAQQQLTQRALDGANEKIIQTGFDLAIAGLRFLELQHFLLDWRAGRMDQAQATYSRTRDPRDRAVMAFLLNEDEPLSQLLAELPADSQVLAYYADGERHDKAGRPAAAIEAFEKGIAASTPRYSRFKQILEARLRQVRDSAGARQPAAGGEGGTAP
jgi:serine/threonine protein kinase